MKKLSILHSQFSTGKGFTLIELMVVISISMIIGALGVASFSTYGRRQEVDQAAKQVQLAFETSRANAISGLKPHAIDGGTGDPKPETCFFNLDGGAINAAEDGDENATQSLLGYRFTPYSSGGVWRLKIAAVCSTSAQVILSDKALSSNISLTVPCSQSFYYEVLTNKFICNLSQPDPADINILTISGFSGAITRTLTIDKDGRATLD